MKTINVTLTEEILQNLKAIKKREGVTSTAEILRFLIKYHYYHPPVSGISVDEEINKEILSIEEKIKKEDAHSFCSLTELMHEV